MLHLKFKLEEFFKGLMKPTSKQVSALKISGKENLFQIPNNGINTTSVNIFSARLDGIATSLPNIMKGIQNSIFIDLPNIFEGTRIPKDMFVYPMPSPNPPNRLPDSLPLPSDDAEDNSISPSHVNITKDVLDSMATHAISCLEPTVRECYGTIYADREGKIVKYHPLDSEEFTLRTEGSVSFTNEFYYHVRRLSKLYEHIELHLAGDNHSHTNGNPQQSNSDIAFNKSFWKNKRNTCFITAIDKSSGSSDWELDERGLEARRKFGGHLIRIRAYAGTGKDKKKITVL